MKANNLYALTAGDQRGVSLYSKMLLVSLIIALMFASLPVVSVFAAPASDGDPMEDGDLEFAWSNKLRNLRAQSFFYDRIRLSSADFENRDDLARAHYYLEKYGVALRQANTVVFNHAGFDIKGNVIDEKQADESLHELAMYLHMMRGFREKMDEINDI